MKRLSGKFALITGGTSGIGLETARLFVEHGASVAITGMDPKRVKGARETLGSGVVAIPSDAADVGAQKKLADAVRTTFGMLDVLVVNAGIADLRPLEAWDEAAYDHSFAVNLKGPFFLIQALRPLFRKGSSIVLTTSINAHIGMANTSVYAATKAGLASLARTLSGELVQSGIRVNAISPGPVTTPLYAKLGLSEEQSKSVSDGILSQIPLGRFGSPGEIAQAILFFASDEAPFLVGSELIIDGGMSTL